MAAKKQSNSSLPLSALDITVAAATLFIAGCVYSPKTYDIEQLIECPIEDAAGVA